MKLQIVLLQRGWIVIGHTKTEGEYLVVENASVIRRWGTTKGLGEIAMGGPTKRTVVDRVGNVMAQQQTVVMLIDCDASKWEGKL